MTGFRNLSDPQELSVGLILDGLTETSITWGRQLVNYMLCSLTKVRESTVKGKDKTSFVIPKPKNPKPSAKEHPTKDETCHYCKEVGHCKRNCPAYLTELIKKKKQVGTASSLDVWGCERYEAGIRLKNCNKDLIEGFELPQVEEIQIRRSERTRRAPNCLCLNVEAEEYSLGDLNEPTSYKAAILDSKSNKWIDAMNAKIQSMMDNMVWVLVDLPPG
ncbi:retrotransposon protein, putative, ty1-copia subclass [Tanacetum coccineum]